LPTVHPAGDLLNTRSLRHQLVAAVKARVEVSSQLTSLTGKKVRSAAEEVRYYLTRANVGVVTCQPISLKQLNSFR
jgi:hypothetical protein